MNNTLNFQKILIVFGIPLSIIGILVALTKSSFFVLNPNSLSFGITFDLLLTVPFVYYLLIRKTNIPKITIVPLMIIGTVICSVILPNSNQFYLNLFKTWIIPLVELFVMGYVIFNLRKVIKHFKLNKSESADFYTTLKSSCSEILPKGFALAFATEIAVFYYGFIHWNKRILNKNEFSYHKESGTATLLIAILLIVAIETFVLHIILAQWSELAASILTFLSVYSGIQLFGFLKSIYKRPLVIQHDTLFLRHGIMNETTIAIANIERIELSSKDIELNKETRKLSFLGGLDSHNIIIHLKEENTLIGLYGIKRRYKVLAMHIDDNTEFYHRLQPLLKP